MFVSVSVFTELSVPVVGSLFHDQSMLFMPLGSPPTELCEFFEEDESEEFDALLLEVDAEDDPEEGSLPLVKNAGSETETEFTPATFKMLVPAVALPVLTEPPSALALLFELESAGLLEWLLSFTFTLLAFEAVPPDAVLPPVEAFVVTSFVTVAVFDVVTDTVFAVIVVSVVV